MRQIQKAKRMSPKVRQLITSNQLADKHALFLLKYSPDVQDQLATFIVDWNQKSPDNKISSTNIGNFCKEYDKEPNDGEDDCHDCNDYYFVFSFHFSSYHLPLLYSSSLLRYMNIRLPTIKEPKTAPAAIQTIGLLPVEP